jgi:hypothetical protein
MHNFLNKNVSIYSMDKQQRGLCLFSRLDMRSDPLDPKEGDDPENEPNGWGRVRFE